MQFQELTSSTTTTFKTGPGFFQGITVNAAGTTWIIQIYDNVAASGTPIAANGATGLTVPAAGSALLYDCHFSNGLTIKTVSGTPGSITVTYY